MRGPTKCVGPKLSDCASVGEFGRLYAYEVHNGNASINHSTSSIVTETCAACICMHSTTVKCADER